MVAVTQEPSPCRFDVECTGSFHEANSIAKERGKKRPFTPLHLRENKREVVASTQNVFILLNRGSLSPLFRGLNGHVPEAARVSTTVTKEKK
jgi:hypothetical protein